MLALDPLGWDADILQDSPVGHLTLGLTLEIAGRSTQHHPVLLEDAKVGGITAFAVAVDVVGFYVVTGSGQLRMYSMERQQDLYLSSMAMAMSMVLPPALRISCLRWPRPETV